MRTRRQAWSCGEETEERWDISVERGELVPVKGDYNRKLPRDLCYSSSQVSSFRTRQVLFPPCTRLLAQARSCMSYCGRVSGGIYARYTKPSFAEYVYVAQQVPGKRLDSASDKLESLLIHQLLINTDCESRKWVICFSKYPCSLNCESRFENIIDTIKFY